MLRLVNSSKSPRTELPQVVFGPEICHDLAAGLEHEWLVTNGIGGFASASLNGANTRRYHGLLVAALNPPLGRTLLLSKLEERVTLGNQRYELQTNQFHNAADVAPRGYELLQSFGLQGSVPTWRYSLGDAVFSKKLWLEHGSNTTYIEYAYESGSAASEELTLELALLVNYRDYHGQTQASPDLRFNIATEQPNHCWRIETSGGTAWRLLAFADKVASPVEFNPTNVWYQGFYWYKENERGLADLEDLYNPGNLICRLAPGQKLTLVATTEAAEVAEKFYHDALERELERERALLATTDLDFVDDSAMPQRLLLAADQFIVGRPQLAAPGHLQQDYRTVLAGYHWFSDWGRDTMIALPGLTLVTNRYSDAANILRSFGRSISQGMLPNRFPDAGETPEYNTVDATLWYFDAINRYYQASHDTELVEELFPTLVNIIEWHLKGTRYGIKVDRADGLLNSGEPGVQLTWMDVKIGDWVVTPRWGKAIEINALWYNALKIMRDFTKHFDFAADVNLQNEYSRLAAQVQQNFEKTFWYEKGGYFYDVIEPDGTPDASLRPNQAIALGVAPELVSPEKARAALQKVKEKLFTPVGLRSLSPDDPRYIGQYTGDMRSRDSAYHQGTIWPWLLGPYAQAILNFSVDKTAALAEIHALVEPFRQQLNEACINSINEVYGGNSPYPAAGCVAQAWSVSALLEMLDMLDS